MGSLFQRCLRDNGTGGRVESRPGETPATLSLPGLDDNGRDSRAARLRAPCARVQIQAICRPAHAVAAVQVDSAVAAGRIASAARVGWADALRAGVHAASAHVPERARYSAQGCAGNGGWIPAVRAVERERDAQAAWFVAQVG